MYIYLIPLIHNFCFTISVYIDSSLFVYIGSSDCSLQGIRGLPTTSVVNLSYRSGYTLHNVIDVTLLCRLITDVIRISGDVAYCRSTFFTRMICCRFVCKQESLLKNIKLGKIFIFAVYL